MASHKLMGLAAAVTLALASNAVASPTFPPLIEGQLRLAYEPPCSICHQDGVTGSGTVTTPFGLTMRAHGLAPGDEGSLAAALGAIEGEGTDSDGDGITDVDELRAGSDPNREGGESLLGPAPAYGCGAHIAGGDPAGWCSAALVGLGLMWLGRRRGKGRERIESSRSR